MGNTLSRFGDESFIGRASAEVFLVNVLYLTSHCSTFDDLRYELYHEKKKSLPELPPSSNMICGHILRSEYTYHASNLLLNFSGFGLNCLDYAFVGKNSVIYPKKCTQPIPTEYLKICGCQIGCKGRCKCKKTLGQW